MISFIIDFGVRKFKPGAIVMKKRHNWFKRIWAKLTKKKLPYNDFELIEDECVWYYPFNLKGYLAKNYKVATPKKNYSFKEVSKLKKLLCGKDDTCKITEKDVITAVNAVRPNTFEQSLIELETNKFYTIETW